MIYRGYEIEATYPPIPIHDHDWQFWPEDDPEAGGQSARSLDEAKALIDDLIDGSEMGL